MRFTTFSRMLAASVTCLLSLAIAVSSGQPDEKSDKDVPAEKPVRPKDEPKDAKPAPAPVSREQAKDKKPVIMRKTEVPAKAAAKGDKKPAAGGWWELAAEVINEVVGNRPKAVVAVPVAIGMANNVQQFEQQFGPQIKQMNRLELHYLRQACQPTRPQFEKIAAISDKEIGATIKKTAGMFQQMQMGRQQANAEPTDPRKLITTTLLAAAKANLSPEQATRYEKEIDQRTVARKRLVLLNLVASIDKRLILTADQRTQLHEILEKNWQPAWNNTQMLMQNGQYLPALPDGKIVPILTETQKSVWRDIQKGNVFWGMDFQMNQGLQIEDEVWAAAEDKK
jgi:hypothetical protein